MSKIITLTDYYYLKTEIDEFLAGKASTSHTHGNITTDGSILNQANKNVVTNSNGKIVTEDKPTIPTANSTATNIKMNGTQSAGSLSTFAKADHVHPTDTSRAAASHTHDDKYYTETEIDTKLNGKANSSHTHGNLQNNGQVGSTAQANKNVVTDANGKITTEDKYTHPSGTVKTGEPSSNKTPGFGDTFTVTQFTSNNTGHISGATDRTVKIPDAEASTSTHGLMSANDKSKLDGVATGATKNTVENSLSSTSTTNALSAAQGKALNTAISNKTVTLTKLSTATTGYIATYEIKQGSTSLGKIDIPKDYLVKSGSVKTVSTANSPVSGYVVGDKYIDFVINTKGNDGTDEHIYINVKDLIDTYTAGTGLNLSNNQFSVKLNSATNSTSTTEAATPSAVKSAYDLANGKAPTSHASTGTGYGVATTANYGHTKIVQNLTTNDGNGLALGAGQGKALKAQIDGIVAGTIATDHNHDGRYYTESEINTKLNGKADSSHTHDYDNINIQYINENIDYNDYKTQGLYGIWYAEQQNNTNRPATCGGLLKVEIIPNGYAQTFYCYGPNSNLIFYRTYYSTSDTWNSWIRIDGQDKENISNKITNITNSSTDTQYPSAKAVYALDTGIKYNFHQIDNNTSTSYYCKFFRIVYSGSYGDTPINFTIYNRGQPNTNVSFYATWNTTNSEYTIGNLYYDGYPRSVYVHHVAKNTFDFYLFAGTWGNYVFSPITTHKTKVGNAITVTKTADMVTTVPTSTTDNPVKQATLNPYYAQVNHTHGNITNDGKIGSTAGKPLITTTNGVITTTNFGTGANTYCQGNDSRLSDARTPTAHNQASSTITEASALSNLGTSANATQATINSKINEKIGTLSSIKAIEVVASKPTASASTMNKLYIVSENNKVNVYYTKQSGSTYTLEKMDEDILDELSIAWNDITGKPIANASTEGIIKKGDMPYVLLQSSDAIAYTGTISNLTGYYSGLTFHGLNWKNATSGANATINLNSLGAKPIYYKGRAITSGELPYSSLCTFMYVGSDWSAFNGGNGCWLLVDKHYNAGTNLSLSGSTFNHATSGVGAKSSGLYKTTIDAQGHITAATAVAKADITGLGIPAQDTTYTADESTLTKSSSNAFSIKDKGVVTGKLADSAVTSAKIADGTIVNGDIANETIDMKKLAIHAYGGTTGTAGYVKILRFTITGTYQDRPTQFKIERRHATEIINCFVTFKGASNTDPDLGSFVCSNEIGFADNLWNAELYMYKEDTSTWSLIVRKSENYDVVVLRELLGNNSGITVTKIQEFITSLPTGSSTNPLKEIICLNTLTEYIEGTHGTTATGTWTGTTSKIERLTKGTTIYFKMTSAGSGNATLTLTFPNGYTTGAKEVWYNASTRLTTQFPQNTVLCLVFDGSKWINTAIQNTNITYTPASATPLADSTLGTVGTSAKYAREDHAHPNFDFAGMKGTDNTEGYVKCLQLKITQNYQDMPINIEVYQRDRTEKSVVQIKYGNLSNTDPGLTSITHTGANISFYLYKESTSTWSLIASKGHNNKYGYMDVKIDNPNTGITITKLDTHIATADLPTSNITQSTYIGFTSAEKTKLAGIATGANAYSHPTSYGAKTGVPTANATLTHGGTFTVTQPVTDAMGHVTALNTRTYTLPTDNNTTYSKGNGLLLNGTTFSADFGTGTNQVARGDHTHKNLVKTEITSGSLDTFTATGWYSYNTTNSNSITNVPEKTGSVMEVLDDYGNGSYVIQKVYPIRSDKDQIIYYRVKFDTSGWSSWRRIDGGDKANASHTHNYLPTNANGTTTGTLTATKFINSSSNNTNILLGNGNTLAQSTFATSGHNHNGTYISTTAGSVGASNLASNAVEEAKIKDGAVTHEKLSATIIPNGTSSTHNSLDNYTHVGFYYQGNNNNTKYIDKLPRAEKAFWLLVEDWGTGNYTKQTLTHYDTNQTYTRIRNNGTWGTWKEISADTVYTHPSTHAATMITDATAHSNIGSAANANQGAINSAIDTALSNKQAKGSYAAASHTHNFTDLNSLPATSVELIALPSGWSGNKLEFVKNYKTVVCSANFVVPAQSSGQQTLEVCTIPSGYEPLSSLVNIRATCIHPESASFIPAQLSADKVNNVWKIRVYVRLQSTATPIRTQLTWISG